MRKSEIFDSFVKIAQEKGLVSKDAPEKAQKIIDKTRRADSLSIEDISKLYNVKPDSPIEMHYVRNIIENAHPKPFVISPSYDKLNGLVENENERQDITLHILHQQNNGQNTQRKYAKKDLLMSLVRLGNDLDNRNQDKLCSLADFCLTQLSDNMMKKEGQLSLVVGAAALLGTLYWQQHSETWSQGFAKDSAVLVSEIKDLTQRGSSVTFYGYQYRPDFIAQMQDFQQKVVSLYNMYNSEVVPLLNQVEKPRSPKDLLAAIKTPIAQKAIQVHGDFAKYAGAMLTYLNQIQDEFGEEDFKQRQIKDEGFFSNLLDKTQVLHGGKGLVRDDFDDVKALIPAYKTDLQNIVASLVKAEQFKNTAMTSLRDAASEASSWSQTSPTTPASVPASPTDATEEVASAPEEGVDELEKQLSEEGLE